MSDSRLRAEEPLRPAARRGVDGFCSLGLVSRASRVLRFIRRKTRPQLARALRRMASSAAPFPRARFAVSPIVAAVAPSKTVAIFSQTSDMKSRGETVNAALCVGQPDFPPPPAVVAATAEAATRGLTTYTALLGTLELRKAICEYLALKKGVTYAEDEVMVSGGGKQAIYQALVALCQQGDEVIVPAPYYTSYPDMIGLASASTVILPTKASDGYLPTVEALEAALTERTRILILCNPCNPTGAVIPGERLEQIAALLRRPEHAHVLVLSDEIYEAITYGVPHVAFASLEGMKERTLTINGFSKAYSMTGYRLGAPRSCCLASTTGRALARLVRRCLPHLSVLAPLRPSASLSARCGLRLPRRACTHHQGCGAAARADFIVRQLDLAARGRRCAAPHARRADGAACVRAARKTRPRPQPAPADPGRRLPHAGGRVLPVA